MADLSSRGLLETDPSMDVDGFDSSAKLAILANVLGKSEVTLHSVRREGIRGVTVEQLLQGTRSREEKSSKKIF